MIQGWTEVTQQGYIPQGVRVDPNFRNYGINTPVPKVGDYGRWFTEEQECPDCQFKCSINDPMGYHTCPEVRIGGNDLIHVGEFVYFTAHDKVARGVVTKYKKSTGNIGIRNIETQANFNVNRLSRIMKASEDEQRYFEQIINGPI